MGEGSGDKVTKIAPEFEMNLPEATGRARNVAARGFTELLQLLVSQLPADKQTSREKSLIVTKLQEAQDWFHRAVPLEGRRIP